MNILIKSLFILLLGAPVMLLATDVVDINTAGEEELKALDGIGDVKAEAIVEYRTEKGPFKSVEDLENVEGIGKKTVEKNLDNATVTAAPAQASAEQEVSDDFEEVGDESEEAGDDSEGAGDDSEGADDDSEEAGDDF